MGDGGSFGVKQIAGEMGQAAKEVVKEDVSGAIKDIGQQAMESLTGSYQDPQKSLQNQPNPPQQLQQQQAQAQQMQQKQDEQKRMSWARSVIDYFKKTNREVKQVGDKRQQEWMQRQQEEQQKSEKEKAEAERRKQAIPNPAKAKTGPGIMPGKKPLTEDVARSHQELSAGRGKGG